MRTSEFVSVRKKETGRDEGSLHVHNGGKAKSN